jgi:hypothetical protein
VLSELRFLTCGIHVAFAETADLKALRAAALGAGDDPHTRELNLSVPESQENQIVLRSRTGSSQVQLTPVLAALQTSYFDSYSPMDDSGLRANYGVGKLSALLTLLDRAHVTPAMVGVVVTARAAAEPMEDIAAVSRACSRAFNLQGTLTEGEDLLDFNLRVARRADENTYSNIYVSQYEERTFHISGPLVRPLHEWDGQVSTRGIELKYDRNNKLGLLSGRRDRDATFFLELCRNTVEAAPRALGGVLDLIRSQL